MYHGRKSNHIGVLTSGGAPRMNALQSVTSCKNRIGQRTESKESEEVVGLLNEIIDLSARDVSDTIRERWNDSSDSPLRGNAYRRTAKQ